MSLQIINLSKSFEDKIIFDNFSYGFQDKGLYIISGDSGKGKTTLLRIIAGLDKSYKGTVTGGGNVSYLFQEYRLFPNLNLIDNVLSISFESYTDREKRKTADLLLSLGFSKDDFDLMPDELSGGMKQRVSFARAILYEAPVLLLDEPTKELDSALKEQILKIIIKESEKRLVIFVTHDEDSLAIVNSEKIIL